MRRPWPLRLLLVANAVSVTGTAMTVLALPWFVLVTTGSAGRTGLAAACEMLPMVLASAFGGPLIDTLGARRSAIASDLLSAGGIALVPLLHATVGLAFWQLCAVIAFVGLVRAPGQTARTVLLPQLTELAQLPIERTAGAFDGVNRTGRMIGAPAAGGLIALLGPADVILVDAASFLVSGLLLTAALTGMAHERLAGPRYLAQLREGVVALRTDRLLLGMVAMVMVTNTVDAASASVLTPVFAREVLHSSVALGFLFGTFGLGAVLGTVLYGALGPRLPRWPVFTIAFLVVGLPKFAVLAAEPPHAVLYASQLVCGVGAGVLNPVLSVVELERIPPALQSRVFGVISAGALAGMPVGAVLGGWAVAQVGIRAALLAAGGVYLLATLSPVVWRSTWREMDAPASRTRDDDLDQHLDDVTDAQRPHRLGVGRDPEVRLPHGGASGDAEPLVLVDDDDLDGVRTRPAVQRELA